MPSALPEVFDLDAIERRVCVDALDLAGNIVDAAYRLGITRQEMKRRIKKHRIAWPRQASGRLRSATGASVAAAASA